MFYKNIPGVNISVNEVGLMELQAEEQQQGVDFIQPRNMVIVGTAIDGANPVGQFTKLGYNTDNNALDYLNAKSIYGNAYEEYMVKDVKYEQGSMTLIDKKEVRLTSNLLKAIKIVADQGVEEAYTMRLRTEEQDIEKSVYSTDGGTFTEVTSEEEHIQDIKDGFGNYNRKFINYLFSVQMTSDLQFDFRAASMQDFENSQGSANDPFLSGQNRSIDNTDPLVTIQFKADFKNFIDNDAEQTIEIETLSGDSYSLKVGGNNDDAMLVIRVNISPNGSLGTQLTPILKVANGKEYGLQRIKIGNSAWIDDIINKVVNISESSYNVTENDIIAADILSLSSGYNVDIYQVPEYFSTDVSQLITFKPVESKQGKLVREDVDTLFFLLLTNPSIYYIVVADELSKYSVVVDGEEHQLYDYLRMKMDSMYDFENREGILFAGVDKTVVANYHPNRHMVLVAQEAKVSWNPSRTQLVSTYKDTFSSVYDSMIESPAILAAAQAGMDKAFRDQPGNLADSTMDQERVRVKRVFDGSVFSHGIKELYNRYNPESGYMYVRKDLVELQNLNTFAFKEDKSKGIITVVRDLTFADPYKNPGLKFVSIKVNADVTRQRLRSQLRDFIGKRNNPAVRTNILEKGNYVLRYNRDNDRMYERLPDLLAEGFSLKFDEQKMNEYPRQLGKIFLNCKIVPPFAIQEINIDVIVE